MHKFEDNFHKEFTFIPFNNEKFGLTYLSFKEYKDKLETSLLLKENFYFLNKIGIDIILTNKLLIEAFDFKDNNLTNKNIKLINEIFNASFKDIKAVKNQDEYIKFTISSSKEKIMAKLKYNSENLTSLEKENLFKELLNNSILNKKNQLININSNLHHFWTVDLCSIKKDFNGLYESFEKNKNNYLLSDLDKKLMSEFLVYLKTIGFMFEFENYNG